MRSTFAFAISMIAALPAHAAEGVIEINQVRALAGGVTPGDTPGFPVTLDQPGSYRMTSNLVVDGGTDAIVIAADNVSLDMNGFAIQGPRVCSGTPVSSCTGGASGSGVVSLGTVAASEVRNGSVSGMTTGVALNAGRIEAVRVHDNYTGLQFYQSGTITNSHAHRNEATGIAAGGSTVVSHSTGYGNGSTGIQVSGSATIISNAVASNGAYGIFGYGQSGSATAIISRNTVRFNDGEGISIANGLVSQNNVHQNGGDGIYISGNGTAIDNISAANGGWGIRGFGTLGLSGNLTRDNTQGHLVGGTRVQTGPNICGTALCS